MMARNPHKKLGCRRNFHMSTPTGASDLLPLLVAEGGQVVNFKCFVGDGPFTKDELRAEVKSALQQRRDGLATVSENFDDDAPKVDFRAVIATLQR